MGDEEKKSVDEQVSLTDENPPRETRTQRETPEDVLTECSSETRTQRETSKDVLTECSSETRTQRETSKDVLTPAFKLPAKGKWFSLRETALIVGVSVGIVHKWKKDRSRRQIFLQP